MKILNSHEHQLGTLAQQIALKGYYTFLGGGFSPMQHFKHYTQLLLPEL